MKNRWARSHSSLPFRRFFCLSWPVAESKILNNAARILQLVQAGTPADQALRENLTQDRHFTAPAERTLLMSKPV